MKKILSNRYFIKLCCINVFILLIFNNLSYVFTAEDRVPALPQVDQYFAGAIIKDLGGENGKLSLAKFQAFIDHLRNHSKSFSGVSYNIDDELDNGHHILSLTRNNRHDSLNCTDLSHDDAVLSSLCNATQYCSSAKELLKTTFRRNTIADDLTSISSRQLVRLCPILLYQLKEGTCSFNGDESSESLKPSAAEVWGYGMLFVTVINLSSLLGVSLLPLMEKKFYNQLLICLIGLAVGSLSGSAIFHLIPQAFSLDELADHHHYLWICLLINLGIYFFFMIERILNVIMYSKKRSKHSLQLPCHSSVEVLQTPNVVDNLKTPAVGSIKPIAQKIKVCDAYHHHSQGHKHEHHIEFKQGQDSAIATVAWMIVFGDGIHNFIDGVSIGAAFNESILTGVSISLAVACEEFPHELGDFAVLLNSGMTMKQALLYNFLSACTCYLGLVVGILLGELAEAGPYVFAMAAGVFLYISLVDMLPEMNEEAENAGREGVSAALKVIGLQNIGWLSGTFGLFALAYYSEWFNFL